MDAKSSQNAAKIQNIKSTCNCNITASRHTVMNSTKGTVLVPHTEFNSTVNIEEKILEQAKLQNLPVSEVECYSKISPCTKRSMLFAKLTFQSRSLPAHMYIGFERLKIQEDLPRPRQCCNCWKYGHPTKYCTSNHCCPLCSKEDHDYDDCPQNRDRVFKGHCPNCEEKGHTAFSKKCKLYMKENEILLLMRRQGITKREARKLVEDNSLLEAHPMQAGRPPSKVKHHNINSNVKISPNSQANHTSRKINHKTTRSIYQSNSRRTLKASHWKPVQALKPPTQKTPNRQAPGRTRHLRFWSEK